MNNPILIKDSPESLGMLIPKLSIRDIAECIGFEYPVNIMDVHTQEEIPNWNLGDLVNYFECTKRKEKLAKYYSSDNQMEFDISTLPRVLNQISLEFSKTPLRHKVQSPQFVRDIDWIENAWPSDRKLHHNEYPRVQYYCLTSTAGCFTDFHIDFGGTSVWYHVISGLKVFLLIPPTRRNLASYEEWLCDPNQSNVFFGDLCPKEECFKIELLPGNTMFIPTGWIHAVYTPKDSIVIGGNLLHSFDIPGQLDIYCIETRTHVPKKFRFPNFLQMMFYAGAHLLRRAVLSTFITTTTTTTNKNLNNNLDTNGLQKQSNDTKQITKLSCVERKGVTKLVDAFKQWQITFPLASTADNTNSFKKGSVEEVMIHVTKSVGCETISEFIQELQKLCHTENNNPQFKQEIIDAVIRNNMERKTSSANKSKMKLKLTLKKPSFDSKMHENSSTTSPRQITANANSPPISPEFEIFVPKQKVFSLNNSAKPAKHQQIDSSYAINIDANNIDDEWRPSGIKRESSKKARSATKNNTNKNTYNDTTSSQKKMNVDDNNNQYKASSKSMSNQISTLRNNIGKRVVPVTKKSASKKGSSVRDRLKKKLRFV